MAVPSPTGSMNESCFSDVMPVSGWNQCAKWVAPCSMAHVFIACATVLATSKSSGLPSLMVRESILYVSEGRYCFITWSENTMVP